MGKLTIDEIYPKFKELQILLKRYRSLMDELYEVTEELNTDFDIGIKINVTMEKKIPKPPEPPLCRVLRQGISTLCPNCHSTMPRSGFLMLFGKRYCDNEKCFNSKPKK